MSGRRKRHPQVEFDASSPAARQWRSAARAVVIGVLVVAAIATMAQGVWLLVRDRVTASPELLLDPEMIDVTPPPDWIRADIRAEVIRDGNLDDGLSMLDDDLARRVSEAFQLHPWVRRATATKTYPGRVHVELEYRRPAVVVETSTGGLVPLDHDAVRLPDDSLSTHDKSQLPLVAGVVDPGVVGVASDDTMLLAATNLATLLAERWVPLRLARIVPFTTRKGGAILITLDVWTQGGTQIHWGRPPGGDSHDEPSPAAKLEMIDRATSRSGSLDEAAVGGVLDLRRKSP